MDSKLLDGKKTGNSFQLGAPSSNGGVGGWAYSGTTFEGLSEAACFVRFPSSGPSEPKCVGITTVDPAAALRIGEMYAKLRGDPGYMALYEPLEIQRMRSLPLSPLPHFPMSSPLYWSAWDYLQFLPFLPVPSLHHGDGVWEAHDRWFWNVQLPENRSFYSLFQPSWSQLRSHTGLFAATRILHLGKFLFSLKNQTTSKAKDGKGNNGNLGHQLSIFLPFLSCLQSYCSRRVYFRPLQRLSEQYSNSIPKWHHSQHWEKWFLHMGQL